MDYWPSEEQDLIQQSLRDFLSSESSPSKVRDYYDSEQTFDHALWKSIAELGFAGTCIPSEYGGSELNLIEAALVSEELGRHTTPLFLEGHTLAGLAIAQGASTAQKEALLPELAAGNQFATLALSNDSNQAKWCDWELAPENSGQVTLKNVPNADVADVFIVGCSGNRLGLLEKSKAELQVSNAGGIDQSRQIFDITFDAGCIELLTGFTGEQLCNALLTLIAADAFGAANKMVEITSAYTMEREQFGQPLAQFQAVKHQLANFALGVITARGLFWKAALEFDLNAESASRSASMAKAQICDQAFQVARGIVELHGGIGITWEADVQFYFKRAMFDRNYLGIPDVHWQRCADLAGWNE